MDFGKHDMAILLTMSFGIIVMSFTFPALGMTDDSDKVNESDIPEFNISGERFDFAGDMPEQRKRVSSPSQGVLVYNESRGQQFANSTWLYGDTQDGWKLTLYNNGTSSNTELQTRMRYYFGGSTEVTYTFPDTEYDKSNGFDAIEITNSNRGNWSFELDLLEYENPDQSNFTASMEFEIFDQPDVSDGSWLERLPVVGGIFSTADAVGSFLAWLASVVFWFSLSTFQFLINGAVILFDIVVYLVSMAQWLTGTYTAIVSSAPVWAGVVLTIPGILIFAEFAKLMMLGISLFPFT